MDSNPNTATGTAIYTNRKRTTGENPGRFCIRNLIGYGSFGLFFGCLFVACTPKEPAAESFAVLSGFELTRVAAEPLVKDPVALAFDEKGHALVLEMPGYPFGEAQSRIVVLKDTDGDGVFDGKHVFAEGLQQATSLLPYKKGVLVAAPPYLLFVRDDNQDYVPEQVDTLMGGFSTGNLQHNYNGLSHGPDNWIYAANGGNDGAPYWWPDSTDQMPLRGQDFRFQPDSGQMERLGESSGGFGLALDPYGRVFETHNMEHISHLVFPDTYIAGQPLLIGHTLENISDHEEHGTSRIYPIGEQEARINHPEQSGYFSGSCGIMYYGGGAFGPEYENTVWVADVVLNLIHVDKLQPRGASFSASRLLEEQEFLASTDRSFRPVNMTVGPDGSIFVVDMYRQVIEHPEWIPDAIEDTLDLGAGMDQGRIYRISRTGSAEPFDAARFTSEGGLLESLSHPNQWVRTTAHRLLVEQGVSGKSLKQLRTLLTAGNAYAKLHAAYILKHRDALAETDLIQLLATENRALQEVALRLAETRLDSSTALAGACIEMLRSDDARVRMQAALSLSRFDRNGTAFQDLSKPFFEALLDASRNEPDDFNSAALALAAREQSARLFAELVNDQRAPGNLLASLALQASQEADGALAVLGALPESSVSIPDQKRVIQQLTNNVNPGWAGTLETPISRLEASGRPDLLPELAALRKRLRLPESEQFLAHSQAALVQVADRSLPDSVRIRQLDLLELVPYPKKAGVLFACLNNNQPSQLQQRALRQLANYPGEKEIGVRIVSMWRELSPQTRRYAGDLLLYREVHHDALLTGLENGVINIGEMNFDLERRRQLLWWTEDENTKRRAEKLFSDSGVSNRGEALAQMKPALSMQGSAQRGKEVFELVCANCHQFGDLGAQVGPSLTDIGRKSKETLLHDILDPNAAADPQYINHRLETTAGSVHMGIIASETDQALTMKKIGGESVVVNKNDIKSFRSLGTSLMMEGLENTMSPAEMADLLAYLQGGSAVQNPEP